MSPLDQQRTRTADKWGLLSVLQIIMNKTDDLIFKSTGNRNEHNGNNGNIISLKSGCHPQWPSEVRASHKSVRLPNKVRS